MLVCLGALVLGYFGTVVLLCFGVWVFLCVGDVVCLCCCGRCCGLFVDAVVVVVVVVGVWCWVVGRVGAFVVLMCFCAFCMFDAVFMWCCDKFVFGSSGRLVFRVVVAVWRRFFWSLRLHWCCVFAF